jgi:hypothetical protein
MSAPFVSGAFATLIPFHPDWSEKRLLDRLTATARKIDQVAFLDGLGAGALDLSAALSAEALASDRNTIYQTN